MCNCAVCRLPYDQGSDKLCPSCLNLLVRQRAIQNGYMEGQQIDYLRPYVKLGRACHACKNDNCTCSCDICKKLHAECDCSAATILEHYNIFGAAPPASERKPSVSSSIPPVATLAKASGFK